jgi:hypothetical protein
MAPEDVLAGFNTLGQTLNPNSASQTLDYTPASVAHMAGLEPLLLVQHPAATAAAVQQLQGLVQDQALRQQLVYSAPQVRGHQCCWVELASWRSLQHQCAQPAESGRAT